MAEFLLFFCIILGLIVIISITNEKLIHIPNDIALLLFSLGICIVFTLACRFLPLEALQTAKQKLLSFKFEEYLLDGVLCFMLFAGAGKVRFKKFSSNLKTITLLSFLTTGISSFLYGALFFLAAQALNWPLSFWTCVMLGCIVSPTDPIAATGIMNKLGLSKNVTTVIESESLFNDGIGVALFAFVRSLVTNAGRENFLLLILREVGGAAAVAATVSLILFVVFKLSRKPINHIFISLFAVSLVYVLCELCGFSGVIASVLCGMIFSYGIEKIDRFRQVVDPHDSYNQFWESIDNLLNSVLFVLIGISAIRLPISGKLPFIAVSAIFFGLIARAVGVAIPSLVIKSRVIPGGYSLPEFVALMTWSALKGGLSLAMVLSTESFLSSEIYDILLATTYITIFFTVIVQGLSTKRAYGLIEKHKSKRLRKEGDKRCA